MLVKKKEAASSPIQFDQLTNEDKLSWLMDEYGDMVVRLAYTYVKQKQLAEDISQEVFISCTQEWQKLLPRFPVLAYLSNKRNINMHYMM